MRIRDRIDRWFNEAAQYNADRKTYHKHIDKLMGVVERNDAKLLKKGLEHLASLNYSNKSEFDRLVDKSIDLDHEESFSVLYDHVNDPAYMLSSLTHLGFGAGYEVDSQSLLYKAIDAGSPKISLMLANDPQVDITKSGYHDVGLFTLYMNVNEQTYYDRPFEKACKTPGMEQVLSVLEKRTIELKLKKIKEEAGELNKNTLNRQP